MFADTYTWVNVAHDAILCAFGIAFVICAAWVAVKFLDIVSEDGNERTRD